MEKVVLGQNAYVCTFLMVSICFHFVLHPNSRSFRSKPSSVGHHVWTKWCNDGTESRGSTTYLVNRLWSVAMSIFVCDVLFDAKARAYKKLKTPSNTLKPSTVITKAIKCLQIPKTGSNGSLNVFDNNVSSWLVARVAIVAIFPNYSETHVLFGGFAFAAKQNWESLFFEKKL